MDTQIWDSKQQRDQFFQELRDLLAKYPNIALNQRREYERRPELLADYEVEDDGYPRWDPESPMILHGIVLLVNHSNLEHFEDLQLLIPFEQSNYHTVGMLSNALMVQQEG